MLPPTAAPHLDGGAVKLQVLHRDTRPAIQRASPWRIDCHSLPESRQPVAPVTCPLPISPRPLVHRSNVLVAQTRSQVVGPRFDFDSRHRRAVCLLRFPSCSTRPYLPRDAVSTSFVAFHVCVRVFINWFIGTVLGIIDTSGTTQILDRTLLLSGGNLVARDANTSLPPSGRPTAACRCYRSIFVLVSARTVASDALPTIGGESLCVLPPRSGGTMQWHARPLVRE